MGHRFGDSEPGEEQTRQLTSVDEIVYRRFAVQLEGTAVRDPVLVRSDGDELDIGSAAGCALELGDPTVSRHHCAIRVTPRGFLLRDLGSTNGTYVDGRRIERVYLQSGDCFVVGQSRLRFRSLDEQVRQPISPEHRFGDVLGRSAAMRRIFALLPRIAASGSSVLLEGETGTGKGMIASAIHDASSRQGGPFVVVDCGAITPTLIESQLFGHARGAFTGADRDRSGAFETAEAGTIFLDEIGELPRELQPKLLRVLDERTVVPLGTSSPRAVDVRVIAATNRDLRAEVNSGAFRADLFYRLHVLRLELPPLRERVEDIELLVRHFYEQLSPAAPDPPADLLRSWQGLRWAGNVRELRAAVERALLFGVDAASTSAPSTKEGGAAEIDLSVPFRQAKQQLVAHFERSYLAALMERHRGNVSQAARATRIDRSYLRELLRKHGLGTRRS